LGAYSFSGLLAGVFRNFGKVGVIAGFVLGNIILSLYLTNYGQLANILAETGVAVLFIIMIPRRTIDRIKIFMKTQIPGEQRTLIRDMRFKEVVQARFREWSRMFSELSRTFEQVSSTAQRSREEKGLQDLFNEVTGRVCDGCALYRTCWEREFYKTYQDILDLFSMVEAYGKVDVDDVPENLRRRCGRVKEICVTVECLYDSYKTNQYWSDRFGESRDIVSEQLKGVANIMANLSEEIELDLGKDHGLDKKIKGELAKQNIRVVDLYTVSKENDKYEINISMHPCGGKMECQSSIAPAVSSITGQDFAVAGHCSHKKGEEVCSFRLYPSLTYRVAAGVAKIGKHGSNISGDSYSFRQLGDGNFAVILSDGMGAGPRAALESSTTVSLLEHLLESGFGHALSIKTVNSILTLRSFDDESFSTIDLAIVNLYTGEVSFSKIGASPSYLIRGNRIKTVFAESLPAGVIDDIEVGYQVRVLKEGDMLVMVSDGALDSCMTNDKEEGFTQILKRTIGLDKSLLLNPQDFASCLLKEAYKDYGGHKMVKDDITIIATLLEKSIK
ncbi:MAG TPA: stage II sporulation protein E, partial [Clostridia bacterium]|nr:stage II sporulation protein E [Clostridia bacterium]